MAKTVFNSDTTLLCTTGIIDRAEREKDFRKIWPEMEKLYANGDPSLFRKFSFFVYRSFNERFLEGRTPRQHFYQLKNYFDFFMSDLAPISDNSGLGGLPGALVNVKPPLDKSLPSVEKRMASTGIMIHAADSPFIFENIGGYLNMTERYIFSSIHPVMTVRREHGRVVDILPPEEEGKKEVFIKFVIRKLVNPKDIKKLESEIISILNALYLSVYDFGRMTEETSKLQIELCRDRQDRKDAPEIAEFLKWLVPQNFIFMGMTRFDVVKRKGGAHLAERNESRMGVYRDRELMNTVYPGLAEEIEERILKTLHVREVMALDFLLNSPSIIYNPVAVDAMIIRQHAKDDVPLSVTVLLGRLARGALTSRSSDIPILRKKLDGILRAE
ncbi:MAG: hypothetical protein IEMM0002_1235 [bacterium]|nr:MAG: hypothetical protein IEMM0002_1235 [bacterium]